MKRIALFGLAAAAMPLASVASDSVWKDALVRMEGASDLNQNGVGLYPFFERRISPNP